MSAESDPFERVWFNRRAIGTKSPTMHESAACATRGQDAQAVPSFRALAETADAKACKSCIDRYNQAEDETWTAEAVRDLRAERYWTQADLADALGCASSTVANWETGYGQPGHEMVAALDALVDDDSGTIPQRDVDWDRLEPAIVPVDTDGRPERHVCQDCGRPFDSLRGLGSHQSDTDCERCAECQALDGNSLEFAVHRTEAHGASYEMLNRVQPGEFEAAARAADSVPDLADTLGFSNQRVIRLLNIYDLDVGVDDATEPAGDPDWVATEAGASEDAVSWRDVATDGGD